jgi:type II secretory pathway component PulM
MTEAEAKLKQQRIPGTVPKRIAEIQDAAEELKEIRAGRMEAGEEEEKAQVKLKELMKKHGIKAYRLDDDFEAILEAPEARAYVRRIKGKKKARKSADAEE